MNLSSIALLVAALAHAFVVALVLGMTGGFDAAYATMAIGYAILAGLATRRPLPASFAALGLFLGFLIYRWSIGFLWAGMLYNVVALIAIAFAIRSGVLDELDRTGGRPVK